ncbi:MAG: PAS domain-containing protein, partial [Lachnospiraceae bacterium]|nr:PAS domain-containing protein [Lachnospiraceae bacterium]
MGNESVDAFLEHISLILNTLPCGFICFLPASRDYKVIFTNENIHDEIGVQIFDLDGSEDYTFFDFIYPTDYEIAKSCLEKLESESIVTDTYRVNCKGGSFKWMLVHHQILKFNN